MGLHQIKMLCIAKVTISRINGKTYRMGESFHQLFIKYRLIPRIYEEIQN
jgi:hypothetical protein